MFIKKYSKCMVDYARKYHNRLKKPCKLLYKLYLNLIKVFGYDSEDKLQIVSS